MRAFIVLCIFAAASAASLGYDYGRPSDYGGQSVGGIGYGGVPGAGYSPGQGIQNGPIASNDYSAPAAAPEYEKEYYSFSAPANEFDDSAHPQLNNENVKRGLRVIFIKSPENSGVENAALQLAKSAVEQRTAIYVLHKQADIGDLANRLNVLNKSNDNKPEVHFVKYRTPADAANAQRAIQNQYDGLGGKTSSHDGGVAPVLNFAAKAPASNDSGTYVPAELPKAYLPVSKFL